MIKKLCLLLLVITCNGILTAQEPAVHKQKAFRAWIKLNDNPFVPKGLVYQVSDSSVFLVQSLTYPVPEEFKYTKIDMLKINRDKNVLRGLITGSVIGAATGIIMVNTLGEGMSYMTIPISYTAGLFFGLIGSGIGALAGIIKDRIPVRGDYGNFNNFKGSLCDYSWQHEQIKAPSFEHRGYFGAEGGISFAGGEFASLQNIPLTGYSGMVKTGMAMVTQGGYRFTRNLGINLSLINNMYSLKLTQDAVSGEYTPYWGFDALIISPVLSLPFHQKWRFDFSPGIGYAGTTLSSSEDFVLNGEGFGFQMKGSLTYHYAKRWTASLGSGYLSSKVNYREGGSGKAQVFNISAGLFYHFGKKSL
jgi:hypothetical protein